MKATNWLAGILAAATLGLTGCSKSPPPPAAPAIGGVTIDVPKLQAAFPSPKPDVGAALEDISYGIRYEDYNKCLAALDKLANSPGLTEPQKKTVSDVTEQVKKAAAGRPAK